MLKNKKILLGVNGGIAAYKTTYLVRLLKKMEAEVRVIMTPASFDFVTPLSLSTLSNNSVISDFSDHRGTWNNHVDLALWADLFIVAPCTANTLGKMISGICDNIFMATYLSAKCPVLIAPAMDLDMYKHPSTSENLSILESRGNVIIPAENGSLASGLEGQGRMAEPETIVENIVYQLTTKDFTGKNILITAGPTFENIDPVRFIGNHSTGKMGVNLANELSNRGANITLVIGPSFIKSNKRVKRFDIQTADEMNDIVSEYKSHQDILIMSAAVSDFKPSKSSSEKIKKELGAPTIELVENPDVLKNVGINKKDNQILVGFALETTNEVENAKGKLNRKKLDLIILNSLNDKGAGFKGDTNKITMIDKNLSIDTFELKSKAEVARDIADKILSLELNSQPVN